MEVKKTTVEKVRELAQPIADELGFFLWDVRFEKEGATWYLTFDGSFAVHDIKIVQGEERLFVAMPSRRDDNGVFRDIVHPIDSELRNEIEGEILSAYRMELDRQAAEQQGIS